MQVLTDSEERGWLSCYLRRGLVECISLSQFVCFELRQLRNYTNDTEGELVVDTHYGVTTLKRWRWDIWESME